MIFAKFCKAGSKHPAVSFPLSGKRSDPSLHHNEGVRKFAKLLPTDTEVCWFYLEIVQVLEFLSLSSFLFNKLLLK